MKTLNIVCIFAISIAVGISAVAQIKGSPYELGIQLGTGLYAGDLVPTLISPYKSPGLFLGFSGSRKISNLLALRADISWGKVKADDANYTHPEYRRQRNFNFKTNMLEITASLFWDVLGRYRKLAPYVFAGGGLSLVKVSRDYSNLNPEYFINDPAITTGLPEDIAQRLPRVIPVLPVGAGMRYSLTQKIAITFQTAYRLMSTDYLDGFSKGANPNKKDHYYTHTAGLIYSFGEKNTLACPH